MNTKNVSRGMVSKLQKTLLAVLMVMVLFGSLPAGKAHAWTYMNPVARPGRVYVPTTITVQDIRFACTTDRNGITSCNYAYTLSSPTGPVIYRSPASTGAQAVAAQYQMEQWDGSKWVAISRQGPFIGQIGSLQNYYTFPAPSLSPVGAGRGYYRVTWTFAWSTTTGVSLGGVSVVPNLATDHACATIYRLCQTFPGYVRTGGFQTGQW
ncbi:MAG: hypothetical protein ABIQ77_07885 [Anaerolineales bacterium]